METTAVQGKRVLVVCASKYGSTREIAEKVAEQLREAGCEAEVRGAKEKPSTAGFDAAVVGGPMYFGWHKDALRYVKARRDGLERLPVAYFVVAASLTEDGAEAVEGVAIVKDTWLVKEPKRPGKMSYRENYARPDHYLGDILKATKPVRPRQVAFFGGAVDFTKMNLFEKLFVMLVIGAGGGDARHWDAVRDWARGLPAVLFGDEDAPS